MTPLHSLDRQELAERLSGPGALLQCGPVVMRIGTTLPELVAPLALLYADYPLVDNCRVPHFSTRVDFLPRWRRPLRLAATAVIDGRAAFDPFRRRHALAMFEWALNWCFFSRPHTYLLLHAAVLERDGRSVILSGQPGAGKSTLAAGLMFRGWRLFSDEVGMIRPGTRTLLPLPRPVGLKNDSIDIVRRIAPAATIGPLTYETRKGTVAHLRPRQEDLARAAEGAEPYRVLFPRFVPGAALEVRPVSRADCLLRLGDESFNYSTLGLAGFQTLADVVDGCLGFEIRYGTLDDALAGVDYVTSLASDTSAA